MTLVTRTTHETHAEYEVRRDRAITGAMKRAPNFGYRVLIDPRWQDVAVVTKKGDVITFIAYE